jgi:hypothetical protein
VFSTCEVALVADVSSVLLNLERNRYFWGWLYSFFLSPPVGCPAWLRLGGGAHLGCAGLVYVLSSVVFVEQARHFKRKNVEIAPGFLQLSIEN